MVKRNISDRTLKSLKPTTAGTHVDVWDLGFPGFGVRVSDTGRRTFVLMTTLSRQQQSDAPCAQSFYGRYEFGGGARESPHMAQADRKGYRPFSLRRRTFGRLRYASQNTFEAVCEEFFKRHLSKTRQGRKAEIVIRREFVSWRRDR